MAPGVLPAAGVAESVRLAVATGVAGLSIEDSTGNAASPLFDMHAYVRQFEAATMRMYRDNNGPASDQAAAR